MAEVGRLLLDTHIWLWWLLGDSRLANAPCRGVVEEAEKLHRLGLSAISLWECLLLHGAGRIDLGTDPRGWLEEARRSLVLTVHPVDDRVAIESRCLPGELHRDPADRFIVATARVRGVTLLTRDDRLLTYAAQGHVQAVDVDWTG
jgi:PIN domain nuclease of toxin-antitoxin system